jgi:hypothetical protein
MHPGDKIHQLHARLLEKSSGFRSSPSPAAIMALIVALARRMGAQTGVRLSRVWRQQRAGEVYDFATRLDEPPASFCNHEVRCHTWKTEKSWG